MYYLYFIKDVPIKNDNGFWHIKIGISACVRKRVKELQVGNPRKLEEMFSIPFPSRNEAQKAETYLHRKYRRKRVQGEWFKSEICYNKLVKLVDQFFVNNKVTEINSKDLVNILSTTKTKKKEIKRSQAELRQSLF